MACTQHLSEKCRTRYSVDGSYALPEDCQSREENAGEGFAQAVARGYVPADRKSREEKAFPQSYLKVWGYQFQKQKKIWSDIIRSTGRQALKESEKQSHAPVAIPKVVASFIGRVESLSGDSANVLLVNDQTGERLESRCDAEVLQEKGIASGDEFRFEVVRSKGTTATRLSRIPPKRVSKERVEQIRASFKDRWKF
jgi:hypothetical protein